MDHIGFGISDQATFEMVEIHHSDNLLQLIRHLDLKDVTLAVHDWGGPIGVGTFIQEPWRMTTMEQAFFGIKLGVDYPLPLVDLEESGKKARDKIWSHRKDKLVQQENKRIISTHTRRK